MKEVWKQSLIPEYEVSNCGNVRNKETKHVMKPRINGGYYRLTLRSNGVKIDKYVANMIAETFLPNPLGYDSVDHINMDKLDNNVKNLRYCSNQENQDFRWSASYREKLKEVFEPKQ